MIIRATVANLSREDAAAAGQRSGLSGTLTDSTGFGEWGVEQGVTFEWAGPVTLRTHVRFFVLPLLKALGETAAYVVQDGRPFLWYADGRVSALESPEDPLVVKDKLFVLPSERPGYQEWLAAKARSKEVWWKGRVGHGPVPDPVTEHEAHEAGVCGAAAAGERPEPDYPGRPWWRGRPRC